MRRQGLLYFAFFAVFFSVGAGAVGAAVLCDDFVRYCRSKHYVHEAQLSVQHLQALNADYDGLLEQLESNPDLLKRIAPVMLGTRPDDPCAIYPRARAQELAVARKALMEETDPEAAETPIPAWLRRCSQPTRRIALFIAGAGLIIISLVCFTPQEQDLARVCQGPK